MFTTVLSKQKTKTPPRKFQTFEEIEQRNQKRTADPLGGNRQPDMHHGKRLKKTVTWDYMKKTLTSMFRMLGGTREGVPLIAPTKGCGGRHPQRGAATIV